jgi:hypothetical protein
MLSIRSFTELFRDKITLQDKKESFKRFHTASIAMQYKATEKRLQFYGESFSSQIDKSKKQHALHDCVMEPVICFERPSHHPKNDCARSCVIQYLPDRSGAIF